MTHATSLDADFAAKFNPKRPTTPTDTQRLADFAARYDDLVVLDHIPPDFTPGFTPLCIIEVPPPTEAPPKKETTP